MNLWKIVSKLTYRKFNVWMWLIFVCPIVVVALSFFIISGWIIHSPAVVEIIPGFAPMQFNAALCFLCCSIAFLVGLSGAYQQSRIILLMFTTTMALITFMQYPLSTNFGIDSLFIAPFMSNSIHPGRMAPNTALAFIFISLSMIPLTTSFHLSRYSTLITSLFVSISFALGLVPLLGYITHLDTAYRWGTFATITMESSVCFLLLSVAAFSYIWNRSQKESIWLPIPIFIAFLMVTLSMSSAVYHKGLEPQVSNSYVIVFIFGLIMTILITLCVYLVLKSYEHSKVLTESENRYRMIFEGIKDYAIFMLTPTGHVKNWNKGAKRIMRYTSKEILGKHFSIFYTAADLAKKLPNDILHMAQTKGKYEGEGIGVRSDGSHFWAQILVAPLYDTHQKLMGFVKITRDITERHQMELERSKLIALIEESPDFVGIADLEGNLQFHNRSAKQMVGLPDDYDMTQLKIADMHPKWAANRVLHEAIPTVFKKGSWTGETALLHRSGREIPVLQAVNLHRDMQGIPICFTTTMRDITERKVQEEATKASEEIFRSAMQHASMGMALVSTIGKWLKVNQALCNMLGYSEEELLQMDFQTITYPDDLKIDMNNVLQMLHKQIDSYQMEKRYVRKDGDIIWGLLNVSLVWDIDNTPKYFISQIQNITDRKVAEEANAKLMEALASSNLELERFAYVASHDLQEPIRMINNFGEMLLTEKQETLDEEAKEYLSIMTNSGIRMHDVINDLLTYSSVGKETANFVIFDAEEILNNTLENIKTLIEEQKAQITHDLLPLIYGNPMQIMRLLQNLITNAIKYQPINNTPVIHIGLKSQEKNWVIAIQDNGLGIEEPFVEEIFEPFRRLHTWESIKGTGLGLSICKKIVEIHGGTLFVTSTAGSGSTFCFTIPKIPTTGAS